MELEKCRVCGGMGVIREEERPEYRLVYHGECCECGAKTTDAENCDKAISDWNSMNREGGEDEKA